MVSRIKQLLEWQHLSPTQFADRIGVGRPVISHILSERNKPSLEVVQRIIAAFPELSLAWLLSGAGPMLAPAGGQAPPAPAAPPTAETTPAPVVATAAVAPAPSAAPGPAALPTSPAPAAIKPPSPLELADSQLVRSSVASAATRQPPRFRPGPAVPALTVAQGAASVSALPTATTSLTAALDEVAPTAGPVAGVNAGAPAGPAGAVLAASLGPATDSRASIASATSAATPAESTVAAPAGPMAGNWPAGLGEPGKAIRRIVIFYRDGSFADYQPEQ